MARYFYFDANGETQGPISEEQVKELLAQGIIQSEWPLEMEDGNTVEAGHILFPPARKLSATNELTTQSLHKSSSSGFFDIGFTRFISNTWISIIWVIHIVVHFLGALGAMFYAFSIDGTLGAISILAVPLITLISLLFCRMTLELEVIFFRNRIEHTRVQRVSA